MFKGNHHILVNAVNAVGIMGGGLALEFKNRFPKMYDEYKKFCDGGLYSGGSATLHHVAEELWVVNIVTKIKPQWRSELWLIENGLDDLIEMMRRVTEYMQSKDKTFKPSDLKVGIPKLGCGLGLMDWKVVRRSMVSILDDEPFDITVYGEPYDES